MIWCCLFLGYNFWVSPKILWNNHREENHRHSDVLSRKCSQFHGGFSALAGEGQEKQLKKQVGLQLPQGINLFLALLFLHFFVLPESEEIKVSGFYIYALHFLVVQEASCVGSTYQDGLEEMAPLGTFYIESPLVSRSGCQSQGMPEAQAEGHQVPWEPWWAR